MYVGDSYVITSLVYDRKNILSTDILKNPRTRMICSICHEIIAIPQYSYL